MPRALAARKRSSPAKPWWRTYTFAAWTLVVVATGCDDYTGGGLTPTSRSHVLRVQGSGSGSGTVLAPDAIPELSCTITSGAVSGICSGGYPENSALRLVATPNGRSAFAGWSGACTGPGDCVIEMSQERTVTASFAPPTPAVASKLSISHRSLSRTR